MPEWSTACLDWSRRIVVSETLIPFAPLFPNEAQDALDTFGALRMVDATGSPLMAEVVRPWVTEFVGAVFGAYDEKAARSLISEFFLCISKKNGKSMIAAGIMLTALIRNWRTAGEFIILAPTKEAADNCFRPIMQMIKANEELKELLHVQEYYRSVTHRLTQATLKVVAADSSTVSGKKAIGVFVDELHEFGKQAKAANMLLEATGGLMSRPEGFVIYATTHSEAPPAGVFKQKLDYARKVRDGLVTDNAFLPVIYEFPPEMVASGEDRNIENAYITNPNLGASVDIPTLERRHKQAVEDGDKALQEFLAKHMNCEVGLALGSSRWAGADFWEKQGRPGLTLESIIERSDVIAAGIDVGQTDDLLGLAVIGRDAETQEWLLWVHAWVHEIALERRKSIAPTLRDFEKQGDLTIYSEHGTDVTEVSGLMYMLEETGKLNNIGCDPYAIEAFVQEMIRLGVPQEKLIGISQGAKMMGSIIAAERALAKGTLIHSGCKMMAWCVGNAKIEPVGNAIKITKQAAGTAKIDPVLAMFNAVHLMSIIPAAVTSFWDVPREVA